MSGKQLVAKNSLHKYSCLFLNHTMRGIRGMNDRWLRDQSVFSLLSSLSSLRLIRIRGLGT